MKCRLKPLEYACERVEEPMIQDGEVVGVPGDVVIILDSGTRLVCPAQEFAIHYEIVGEDADEDDASGGDQNADDTRGQENNL